MINLRTIHMSCHDTVDGLWLSNIPSEKKGFRNESNRNLRHTRLAHRRWNGDESETCIVLSKRHQTPVPVCARMIIRSNKTGVRSTVSSHILKSKFFIKFHRIGMKATEIHAIDGKCLLYTPLFEYASVLPHRLPVILCMHINSVFLWYERSDPHCLQESEIDSTKWKEKIKNRRKIIKKNPYVIRKRSKHSQFGNVSQSLCHNVVVVTIDS